MFCMKCGKPLPEDATDPICAQCAAQGAAQPGPEPEMAQAPDGPRPDPWVNPQPEKKPGKPGKKIWIVAVAAVLVVALAVTGVALFLQNRADGGFYAALMGLAEDGEGYGLADSLQSLGQTAAVGLRPGTTQSQLSLQDSTGNTIGLSVAQSRGEDILQLVTDLTLDSPYGAFALDPITLTLAPDRIYLTSDVAQNQYALDVQDLDSFFALSSGTPQGAMAQGYNALFSTPAQGDSTQLLASLGTALLSLDLESLVTEESGVPFQGKDCLAYTLNADGPTLAQRWTQFVDALAQDETFSAAVDQLFQSPATFTLFGDQVTSAAALFDQLRAFAQELETVDQFAFVVYTQDNVSQGATLTVTEGSASSQLTYVRESGRRSLTVAEDGQEILRVEETRTGEGDTWNDSLAVYPGGQASPVFLLSLEHRAVDGQSTDILMLETNGSAMGTLTHTFSGDPAGDAYTAQLDLNSPELSPSFYSLSFAYTAGQVEIQAPDTNAIVITDPQTGFQEAPLYQCIQDLGILDLLFNAILAAQ